MHLLEYVNCLSRVRGDPHARFCGEGVVVNHLLTQPIKGESQVTGVSSIPLIARAEDHGERTAIITPEGVFTYQDLLHASGQVAACLLQSEDDLRERRVAYLRAG